jgi:uncharacterized protein (DUF342 family)
MELENNDYFILYESKKCIYIKVKKLGFDIKSFNDIFTRQSQITITNFLDLKNALDFGTREPVQVGVFMPQIEVWTSSDDLKVYITLNITKEEIENDKNNILSKIILELKDKGITHGIKTEVLNTQLEPKKKILICEAELPQHGIDAVIRYIDLPKFQPKINDNGSADHYDMDFIKEVKQGDWLGEKVVAMEGSPGTNVKGVTLGSKHGKDKLLRYDSRSVEAVAEGNKIILRAKKDGAVTFKDGKICVLDHLVIPGDVDYSTGNIEFSGNVTVKGTVQDGFKVVADKDISILDEMGIGAVEKIHSTNGKIYVKGGVSGKGKAIIEAKNGVYIKYANECTVVCDRDIHIGYYCINSNIKANNIIVDSVRGRIIGGTLSAKAKISSYTIGNVMEKKTFVNVEGFDRKTIKIELDGLLLKYKEYLEILDKNHRTMAVFENCLKDRIDLTNTKDYMQYVDANEEILAKIGALEERRLELMKILESRGEGEVAVFKKAYPKTFIEIKKIQKVIEEATCGTFYSQNNKLHLS